LNQQSIVFSLWSRYQFVETNVDAQNDFGMTPLISSVAFGHEEMVRFLLGKRADANARASNDSSRDTALMLAADKQSTSIVKQLLARGANVRDYNKHGRNALHRAQGRPLDNEDAIRKEIVTMILEKDREGLINAQCTAGKTPLHLASEYGNTPIMAFLLDQGADIEARDSGKRTALILAIESGWPKAVELLLEWGAEQDIEDLMGRTPRKIARRGIGGSREIHALLDKAKKNPKMRRQPSVITKSPRSPQHSNASPFSLSRRSTQSSSTAILSPTASLPSAFPTPRSPGRSGFMPLQLPFSTSSTTSTITPSTKKRRAWSLYSRLSKVGKDPD
jgi:ankyrin repeat protein